MKRYYLGPWTRQTRGSMTFYAPPVGVVGCLDLAPLPVQGVMSEFRPVGLFVTTAAVLPSEYTLIAEGDCREVKSTTRMRDAFLSLTGYAPNGDTLADQIYDCLTDGSDPKGDSAPKPLMPGVNGWLDLHLGGHSRILSAKFEWGKPCSRGRGHWQKIKQLLRNEFEELFTAAKGGKLKDAEHHRRVLDFHCEKYGLKGNDWKELVPTKLQKDVPGRLKHETTITDDFNRADADALGTGSGGWSWSELAGDCDIVSNVASVQTISGSTGSNNRAETDLSSADHYAQVAATIIGTGGNDGGAYARLSASAITGYLAVLFRTGSPYLQIYKVVSGAFTSLSSSTGVTYADGRITKTEANGSTIKGHYHGSEIISITDTAITGNLRTGSHGYIVGGSAGAVTFDDFEAADLGGGGGGLLYTQLERGVRGLQRGTFTKWGS